MINTLDFKKMEIINAGNAGDAFCAGFTAGSITYGIGCLSNWWNPVGWGGTVAILAINAGCVAYATR